MFLQASFSFSGMSSLAAYGEHSFSASHFLTHRGVVFREFESRCFPFLIQGLAAKSRRTYTAGQRQFGQFIRSLAAVFHHGPTLQLVLFVYSRFISLRFGPCIFIWVSLILYTECSIPSAGDERYSALWWISKLASSLESIGNSAHDLPLVKHDFIACCVAYFGFLRAGEFTTSLPFDVFAHLIKADVTSIPVKSVGGSFSPAYSSLELDLVERGCFIYLEPNLSTHESSCSDSILSGGTRHDTRPSICVGRWQFDYSTSSKQLSVHSSLTHGYSRQFSSYSFRSGAETAGAQPAFQFLSSTFLDVGQVMRIALIFALYPIFVLVRWRVYKGLEVVVGQGITNGYLSPTLITGWR